jgi:hypothetical protein
MQDTVRPIAHCAQDHPPPLTIDLNMGCVTQPDPDKVIVAGLDAWSQLKKCKTWVNWLVVGEALLAIRAAAMRAAHVNAPEGRRYQHEFS